MDATIIAGKEHHRNTGIDSFRGMLALLVILGHFFELTDRNNFLTWFGFGFRMPLFIALAGYMFNLDRARAETLGTVMGRYRRLIMPWIVACSIHMIVTQTVDWTTPLYVIIRPPFHLWFVPVMMAFILAARACRLNRATMLAIAMPVSIVAMYIFGVGHDIKQYYYWMPDRRYFVLPIYFAFGMWLAAMPFRPSKPYVTLLLAIIGLLWWSELHTHHSLPDEVAAKAILCIPLISLLPLIKRTPFNLPIINGMGRDSLFFYLWHPLAFGLSAAVGLSGEAMLIATLLSLFVTRALVARLPILCSILGVVPIRKGRGDRMTPFFSSSQRKALQATDH